MIIGAPPETEREHKNKKTQIYREMLDQQIMMNQQYRELQANNKHKYSRTQEYHEQRPLSPIQQYKKHQLPQLKDKNTFFKGHSKYLEITDVPKIQKPRKVYTQQIEEVTSDDDQYNSTCERIIKELQNIKNQPVRFRNRKKVNDSSSSAYRKKHRRQSTQNDHQDSELELQSHYQSALSHHFHSRQSKNNPESRYRQYLTGEMESSKQIDLQTSLKDKIETMTKEREKARERESEKARARVKTFETTSQNEFQNQFDEKPSKSPLPKIDWNKGESQLSRDSGLNRSLSPPSKVQKMSNLDNNKDENNKTEDKRKREQERENEKKKENTQIQIQRQNFLKVLRKVKMRGESLYLKMAKTDK